MYVDDPHVSIPVRFDLAVAAVSTANVPVALAHARQALADAEEAC